jgi:hypothetical protein
MKPKPVTEYKHMNMVSHQDWQLVSAPVIRHNAKDEGGMKETSTWQYSTQNVPLKK